MVFFCLRNNRLSKTFIMNKTLVLHLRYNIKTFHKNDEQTRSELYYTLKPIKQKIPFIFMKGILKKPACRQAGATNRGVSRTRHSIKQKTRFVRNRVFIKKGDDILSHIIAVPSAQAGLTSLFGMGRGEPRRNNHLKAICLRS